MSFLRFAKTADNPTKKNANTPAAGSEPGGEDRARAGRGGGRRITPTVWGIGAALAVAVAGFFLLAFYVIFTWMSGVGIAVPFVLSSAAYGIFIALEARKSSSGRSATAATIAVVIPCIVSVAALITNEWLGGFGVVVSFTVTAVLYAILVARAVRDGSIDHLPLRATAAILLPLLGSGLAIPWLELDPFYTVEFADGLLLAVPTVAGCFAALILLHGRTKRRGRVIAT